MSTHRYNIDVLMALCILKPGERSNSILAYFRARGLEVKHFKKMPLKEGRFWELGGDLILIDAEVEGADISQFLSQCRSEFNSVPVVVFHSGPLGARDAAMIRLGAFDSLSKDIDQWNTQVYLDRAIAQAAQAKKLLSLSWTDQLTGLYNQRFLNENLEREIRRTDRTSKDLTVALLDLDNFRDFNDTYGDLKGDDVLVDIANIIQASIRKGVDSAYRYGGDEFILVLPETNLDQAARTLDRILEKLTWRIPEKFTFSVGLALLGDCNQASNLVRCADEAMNHARDSGGDTVVKAVCSEKEHTWLDGTRVI
jgi:diguanylate cyclase (GGDEF)-like protein